MQRLQVAQLLQTMRRRCHLIEDTLQSVLVPTGLVTVDTLLQGIFPQGLREESVKPVLCC